MEGGVELRDAAVVEAGGVEPWIGGVVDSLGRIGERGIPLPPPDAPVGTNSRANGLGWKLGLSLRVVAGDAAPDCERD